jgi:hypothetical protein
MVGSPGLSIRVSVSGRGKLVSAGSWEQMSTLGMVYPPLALPLEMMLPACKAHTASADGTQVELGFWEWAALWSPTALWSLCNGSCNSSACCKA